MFQAVDPAFHRAVLVAQRHELLSAFPCHFRMWTVPGAPPDGKRRCTTPDVDE